MVRVIVSGLKSEEHMFKESLEEEGIAFVSKLEREFQFTQEDELHLQIKSSVEGKKKRYQVKAKLTVQGKVYTVSELDRDFNQNEWDLNLATKEALGELKKVVEKSKFKPVKGLTEDEALEKREYGN